MGRKGMALNHVCGNQPTPVDGAAWAEKYQGCCAEAEWVEFQQLATDIMRVQLKNQKYSNSHGAAHSLQRAFHAKPTLSVDDAELEFLDPLPTELQVGDFASPGSVHRTKVRFTNANGRRLDDNKKDIRGVALRVAVVPDQGGGPAQDHDLLMTNFPVSHARDARQFVKFAKATAGGPLSLGPGLVMLAYEFGLRETIRMVCNVWHARTKVKSIATETYWSRGAMRWGELAVRTVLSPAPDTAPPRPVDTTDPNFLFHEVSDRLDQRDVRFTLNVQKYVNETETPIEDTAVEWSTEVSPLIPVAILTIPKRKVGEIRSSLPEELPSINFNPWNTSKEFRPLGNLNRARKVSYDASADLRHELRWHTDPPLRNVVLGAGVRRAFQVVNRFRPWYRLGVKPGLINILALRQTLQRENRFDTEVHEAPPVARSVPKPPPDPARVGRTPNGQYNDLSARCMGAVGATFGRNLPPKYESAAANQTPNAIEVSDRLLARKAFRPAPSLNVLAAAWIQFQIHDWVNHKRYPLGEGADVEVTLPRDAKPWRSMVHGAQEDVMKIAGNLPGNARDSRRPLVNKATFWGDASEVYGTDRTVARALRAVRDDKLQNLAGERRPAAAGELALDGGYLPESVTGDPESGFTESWWLGVSAMHTLFAREHNLVCAELRRHYPQMTDDQLYRTGRLIVSALITKIHTLEWTPAILARKTIAIGMSANWYGPKDWLTRLSTWLIDDHASVGIPSTVPEHNGVPYSLTEDFTAVYRLHPLIPDDYLFSDHQTGAALAPILGFKDIQGLVAEDLLKQFGLENVLYSFGTANPGAITLHNFPRALREFERGIGAPRSEQTERIDLAVVDLMRTRERGVPRYNDFRAGLHMPRIKNWTDLTKDPADAWLLKEVYGNIDRVDTMVGLFAETPPEGFGFSDTAFRIFISTATIRIQSDRFLTVDFRPEVYTPFGMDWVKNNTMNSVILRHCPELAAVLPRENAFTPWRVAGGS